MVVAIMRDTWKSVSVGGGGPFRQMNGSMMKPMLPADNWDILLKVHLHSYRHTL